MSELALPEGAAASMARRLPEDLEGHEPTPELTRPRPVVVHYHFFKNAGTSLDRTLRENFGSGWAEIEAAGASTMAPWRLYAIVRANPSVTVVSSHTLDLPPPVVPGVTVIPIVFLRHPLDRIRSVYEFEARQETETLGARKAKETVAREYIRWRLERAQLTGDRSVTDFQTHRLARGIRGRTPLSRALRVVDALPFVGLVEAYDESITRLQAVLSNYFPAVELKTFRENAMAKEASLEERLAQLRSSIGDELFERLSAANRDDLTLWARIRERYTS